MHFGQAKFDVTGLPHPGEEHNVPADAMTTRESDEARDETTKDYYGAGGHYHKKACSISGKSVKNFNMMPYLT